MIHLHSSNTDWSVSHLSVLYTISWTSRPNSSLAACLKMCSRKPSDPRPSCLVIPGSVVSPNLKQTHTFQDRLPLIFNSITVQQDSDCLFFNRINAKTYEIVYSNSNVNGVNLTYTWSKGAESTSSTVTLLCSIKWRISPKQKKKKKRVI